MHDSSKLLKKLVFSSIVFWVSLSSLAMGQTDATSEATLSIFKIQVERVLELANSAREGQIEIEAWPKKRFAELYDPAVCVFNESKPLLRHFDDRTFRVGVDEIYVDGKAIKVNSPEFNALSIHVDPILNLEFSCNVASCSGVIPYNSSEPDTSRLWEILEAEDWIVQPLLQGDVCLNRPNWCDVDREQCVDRGIYFYKSSTRTQLRIRKLLFGRRRHSLQFEFQEDEEPICQEIAIKAIIALGSPDANDEAYLSLCKDNVD